MLPKSTIYDHAAPNSKIKELFVQEVEKIIWSYKLSPATINLPASDGVREIQIVTIALKTAELSQKVLYTMDKAIPSPILFELKHCGRTQYTACYKRPSETDNSQWVVSAYFKSADCADERRLEHPKALPVVLNMGALYEALLLDLLPLKKRDGEKLDALVQRADILRSKESEAAVLLGRVNKEQQFNRRVALNRTLNALKAEIEELRK